MNLLVSMPQLSLPRFEVFQSLVDKFLLSESFLALLEGIFEKPEDVLIDIDG